MAEILFYHLTESTLDEALPGLVQRSVERGWRAVIQCVSEKQRDALDNLLWTYSDDSFLAHATDEEADADLQPVLLTLTQDNANAASIRFLVEGAQVEDITPYQRLVVMFDGHDQEQLERARGQWKQFREMAGHELTYWQQTQDRRWERKA